MLYLFFDLISSVFIVFNLIHAYSITHMIDTYKSYDLNQRISIHFTTFVFFCDCDSVISTLVFFCKVCQTTKPQKDLHVSSGLCKYHWAIQSNIHGFCIVCQTTKSKKLMHGSSNLCKRHWTIQYRTTKRKAITEQEDE